MSFTFYTLEKAPHFGDFIMFSWHYSIFFHGQGTDIRLSSYLYHDTQIALSLSGHGINYHIQVPNKERISLFTTVPKLAQRTIQPYAQNDADKTSPPSLIKSV